MTAWAVADAEPAGPCVLRCHSERAKRVEESLCGAKAKPRRDPSALRVPLHGTRLARDDNISRGARAGAARGAFGMTTCVRPRNTQRAGNAPAPVFCGVIPS